MEIGHEYVAAEAKKGFRGVQKGTALMVEEENCVAWRMYMLQFEYRVMGKGIPGENVDVVRVERLERLSEEEKNSQQKRLMERAHSCMEAWIKNPKVEKNSPVWLLVRGGLEDGN